MCKKLILEVRNRLKALMELEETADNNNEGVNKNWENIVTDYSDSSKACLGYRQQTLKKWMSPDTWKAIESRQKLKRKVMDSKSKRLKERHQEIIRQQTRR